MHLDQVEPWLTERPALCLHDALLDLCGSLREEAFRFSNKRMASVQRWSKIGARNVDRGLGLTHRASGERSPSFVLGGSRQVAWCRQLHDGVVFGTQQFRWSDL